MRHRRTLKLLTGLALVILSVVAIGAAVFWKCLNYEPPFYRQQVASMGDSGVEQADRFESQSLQLRNDIANEGEWEAVFSDDEVNAWLSEKFIRHFADLIPPGVRDPIIAFESDRIHLAFTHDRGPFSSVVWVVARAQVAGDHTIAVSLEKIRAGAVPVPAEELLEPISRQAKAHGIDMRWAWDGDVPVAQINYMPAPGRLDVVLERIMLLDGHLYISGRSDENAGRLSQMALPGRRVLQMAFPQRNDQYRQSEPPKRRRSTTPMT